MTAGQAGDAPQAIPLLEAVDAEVYIADRAYDSDEILDWIAARNATAVIPPHPRRAAPRQTDWSLYKERHKIEALFGKLKQFRRVFARFDKLDRHFLAFVHFAAACVLLR